MLSILFVSEEKVGGRMYYKNMNCIALLVFLSILVFSHTFLLLLITRPLECGEIMSPHPCGYLEFLNEQIHPFPSGFILSFIWTAMTGSITVILSGSLLGLIPTFGSALMATCGAYWIYKYRRKI